MLEQIIEPTLLTQFKEALENSGNVVVTCHKSPDGDAAGSNLALKLILDKLGKKATVVTPDNVPEDMAFLPGYDNIVSLPKTRRWLPRQSTLPILFAVSTSTDCRALLI